MPTCLPTALRQIREEVRNERESRGEKSAGCFANNRLEFAVNVAGVQLGARPKRFSYANRVNLVSWVGSRLQR